MEQKLIENRVNKEVSDLDTTDLLLASYYQLERPCALLSDNGICSIYEIRPLTCRIYISFSDPHSCSAECINESNIPTYLLDLEESASKLLDMIVIVNQDCKHYLLIIYRSKIHHKPV